jgi:hypothetical protein
MFLERDDLIGLKKYTERKRDKYESFDINILEKIN